MLTVYIIILISRIPFFQQAGGYMWSNEQEGVRKPFFFFLIGYWDHKMKCVKKLQLEKPLSKWVEGFWEEARRSAEMMSLPF